MVSMFDLLHPSGLADLRGRGMRRIVDDSHRTVIEKEGVRWVKRSRDPQARPFIEEGPSPVLDGMRTMLEWDMVRREGHLVFEQSGFGAADEESRVHIRARGLLRRVSFGEERQESATGFGARGKAVERTLSALKHHAINDERYLELMGDQLSPPVRKVIEDAISFNRAVLEAVREKTKFGRALVESIPDVRNLTWFDYFRFHHALKKRGRRAKTVRAKNTFAEQLETWVGTEWGLEDLARILQTPVHWTTVDRFKWVNPVIKERLEQKGDLTDEAVAIDRGGSVMIAADELQRELDITVIGLDVQTPDAIRRQSLDGPTPALAQLGGRFPVVALGPRLQFRPADIGKAHFRDLSGRVVFVRDGQVRHYLSKEASQRAVSVVFEHARSRPKGLLYLHSKITVGSPGLFNHLVFDVGGRHARDWELIHVGYLGEPDKVPNPKWDDTEILRVEQEISGLFLFLHRRLGLLAERDSSGSGFDHEGRIKTDQVEKVANAIAASGIARKTLFDLGAISPWSEVNAFTRGEYREAGVVAPHELAWPFTDNRISLIDLLKELNRRTQGLEHGFGAETSGEDGAADAVAVLEEERTQPFSLKVAPEAPAVASKIELPGRGFGQGGDPILAMSTLMKNFDVVITDQTSTPFSDVSELKATLTEDDRPYKVVVTFHSVGDDPSQRSSPQLEVVMANWAGEEQREQVLGLRFVNSIPQDHVLLSQLQRIRGRAMDAAQVGDFRLADQAVQGKNGEHFLDVMVKTINQALGVSEDSFKPVDMDRVLGAFRDVGLTEIGRYGQYKEVARMIWKRLRINDSTPQQLRFVRAWWPILIENGMLDESVQTDAPKRKRGFGAGPESEPNANMVEAVFEADGRFWATAFTHGDDQLLLRMDQSTWLGEVQGRAMYEIFLNKDINLHHKGTIMLYVDEEDRVTHADIDIHSKSEEELPWLRPLLGQWSEMLKGHTLSYGDPVFSNVPRRRKIGSEAPSYRKGPVPLLPPLYRGPGKPLGLGGADFSDGIREPVPGQRVEEARIEARVKSLLAQLGEVDEAQIKLDEPVGKYLGIYTTEDLEKKLVVVTELRTSLANEFNFHEFFNVLTRTTGDIIESIKKELSGFGAQVPRGFWTKNRIAVGIKFLYENGVALNSRAIQSDKSERTKRLLRKKLGVEVTGAALFQGAFRQYKTWPLALRAAGLDPEKIRKRDKMMKWSRPLIVEALQFLHAMGAPLNPKAIEDDKSGKQEKLLFRRFGAKIEGRALYQAIRYYWGSVNEALLAAKISPTAIKRAGERIRWSQTPELIVGAIQHLHKSGVPLNAAAIQHDVSEGIKAILKAYLGTESTGTAVHFGGVEHFGTWDAALRAAGLDPRKVRKRGELMSWTPALIIQAIQLLKKKGVLLNSGAIQKDDSEETKEILRDRFGKEITGIAVSRAAIGHFGSWPAGLKAAGFNPNEIRAAMAWSKEHIVTAIKLLHEASVAVNAGAIQDDRTRRTRMLLKEHFGIEITGKALHSSARNYFGSWDNALIAAGLNPYEIRQKFWARGRLSVIPTQLEVLDREDGTIRRLIGRRAKTPLEQVLVGELIGILSEAVSNIAERDRPLAEVMMMSILSEKKLLSAETLAQRIDFKPSVESVERVLGQLREDEALHSYLIDISAKLAEGVKGFGIAATRALATLHRDTDSYSLPDQGSIVLMTGPEKKLIETFNGLMAATQTGFGQAIFPNLIDQVSGIFVVSEEDSPLALEMSRRLGKGFGIRAKDVYGGGWPKLLRDQAEDLRTRGFIYFGDPDDLPPGLRRAAYPDSAGFGDAIRMFL